MPAISRFKPVRFITTAVTCAALLLAFGAVHAQIRPGDRTREPAGQGDNQPGLTDNADRAGPGARPGGIPRNMVAPDGNRERSEGLDEGVPDLGAQPEFRGAQPRFVPPPGDWKLGVSAYNSETGVMITRVVPGSAAARRGLERGDRIVAVGGYQVGYVGDLMYPLGFEIQRQAGPRGDVLLLVQNVRNSELISLDVRLDRAAGYRPRPLER
jgi:hypothetical protein